LQANEKVAAVQIAGIAAANWSKQR